MLCAFHCRYINCCCCCCCCRSAEEGGGEGLSPAELRALQAARIQRLAVLLAALLRRYVEGDAEGFEVSCAAQYGACSV
jgi:hypothetical protein